MKQLSLLLVIAAILIAVPVVAADLLHLQGVVTDTDGELVDGDLQVLLYTNQTIQEPLYNSSDAFNESLVNGRYDILLGEQQNLSLIHGQEYWLELFVNKEQQLFNGSPRQRFISPVGAVRTIPAATNESHDSLRVQAATNRGVLVQANHSVNDTSRLAPGKLVLNTSTLANTSNYVQFSNPNTSFQVGVSSNDSPQLQINYSFYIAELAQGVRIPRLVIQNQTGFVGVGTQTPQAALDVNGSVHVAANVSISQDLLVARNTTLQGALRLPPQAEPFACSAETAGAVFMREAPVAPCYCNASDWVRFENSSAGC